MRTVSNCQVRTVQLNGIWNKASWIMSCCLVSSDIIDMQLCWHCIQAHSQDWWDGTPKEWIFGPKKWTFIPTSPPLNPLQKPNLKPILWLTVDCWQIWECEYIAPWLCARCHQHEKNMPVSVDIKIWDCSTVWNKTLSLLSCCLYCHQWNNSYISMLTSIWVSNATSKFKLKMHWSIEKPTN